MVVLFSENMTNNMKKYALVTGGSRGIGKAISIKLAEEGYHILVNYVSNEARALETLEEIKKVGSSGELLKFDVSNREETTQVLTSWIEEHKEDRIEVLVNNAGIRKDTLLLRMSEEEWDSVLGIGLDGFYNVTRIVVKSMLSNRYGRIINMASLSGIVGMPGQTNYSATKAGLIGATKALAQEVAKRGITVNAIAPGFVKTDMVEGLDEEALKKMIPMNRFGEPEEIANLVAFLASDKASYITGECISINGGLR